MSHSIVFGYRIDANCIPEALRSRFDGVQTVMVHAQWPDSWYRLGDATEASMELTYNYAQVLWPALNRAYAKLPESVKRETGITAEELQAKGIRAIYGHTGAQVLPILESVAITLGTKRGPDYYKPLPGNVGFCMWCLAEWCKEYPDAVFEGD